MTSGDVLDEALLRVLSAAEDVVVARWGTLDMIRAREQLAVVVQVAREAQKQYHREAVSQRNH